jgi:hypothetical protein
MKFEKREDKAAKRAIIHKWDNWAALHPEDLQHPNADTFFFTHSQEKNAQLLKCSGDKWQTVYTADPARERGQYIMIE